jgi:hypothetical protein
VIVAVPPAEQDPLSPSQRARLARLRRPSASAHTASANLANQIEEACEDVDRVHLAEISARDDEDMAWLVLCDRGWPRDIAVDGQDLALAYGWLAAWAELTSLPVEITSQQDRAKLRWIEARLEQCELPLKRVLPVAMWSVVGPLDATGRATLSYVLKALLALLDARGVAAAAVVRRDELVERFALIRHDARKLGVRAPLAPLDVRAWRATAGVIRSLQE